MRNSTQIALFQMLLNAMDKKLAGHKHYSSRQLKPMDKELEHRTQFKIKHYAGDVVYNINGFLDKNKDTLFQDFKRLLYKSNNSVVSKMWPEGAQNILTVRRCAVYIQLIERLLKLFEITILSVIIIV